MILRASAVVLAAFGLIQLAGGIWLLGLGGTAYYVVAGIALVGCAFCLWRHRTVGLAIYAVYFAASVAWAFAETGGEPWSLLPRLMLPALIGMWLCTPMITRSLASAPGRGRVSVGALVALNLIALPLGSFVHRLQPQTMDPIFQAGVQPAFPARVSTRTMGDVAGSWSSYGRDIQNSRFSPLAQLNADSVDKLEVAWTYRAGLPPAGVLGSIEATPLKIGNLLYFCTGYNDVVALDAETGRQRWRYNARTPPLNPSAAVSRCFLFP